MWIRWALRVVGFFKTARLLPLGPNFSGKEKEKKVKKARENRLMSVSHGWTFPCLPEAGNLVGTTTLGQGCQ